MPKQSEKDIAVQKRNAPHAWLDDTYYRLIRLKWHYLIAATFGFYIGCNLIFGSIYYLFRDGLRPSDLSFLDCCFFSVHTFSTVGYGSISPVSLSVNLLTTLETFVGLIFMALLTGLFFSKFAQPSARFIFTNKFLFTKHYGRNALIFRVANIRSNRVMDAEVKVTALYDEINNEGILYRRLEELPLERAHTPIFLLSLTCVHFVEAGSRSEDMLARLKRGENVEFLVSVRGLDETFGQTIYSTAMYRAADLVEGGQFADILTIHADGTRIIDFSEFDKMKTDHTLRA
jgi:inward rectifier potassium channel